MTNVSNHAHDHHKVLILDFGSQYTQLIARRVRQLRVYCEIHPYSMSFEAVRAFDPKAIILSGGPSSVFDEGAPRVDPQILALELPILGICYGLQILAHLGGGRSYLPPTGSTGGPRCTRGRGSPAPPRPCGRPLPPTSPSRCG